MANRYFVPDLAWAEEYVLDGQEAHHLSAVCRAKSGDSVTLFNGVGLRAEARITAIENRRVRLAIYSLSNATRPAQNLHIGVPFPKGDRVDLLIEKCTELGVDRVSPLRTRRSIVDPGSTKLAKLKRLAIEACKQCGRDFLMTIDDPIAFDEWNHDSNAERWLLDPSGDRLISQLANVPEVVAIGPEGGWDVTELESALSKGWKIVRIPGEILRVETAVLAIAAWVRLQRSE